MVTPTLLERECPKCGHHGSEDDFYRGRAECRRCCKQLDAAYRATPIGILNARTRSFRHSLKKFYGLTLEQYEEKFAAQNGQCAICEQPEKCRNGQGEPRRLSVDHDHATGAIRGLLCTACNALLGYAEDDPERLEAAARYLEASR